MSKREHLDLFLEIPLNAFLLQQGRFHVSFARTPLGHLTLVTFLLRLQLLDFLALKRE